MKNSPVLNKYNFNYDNKKLTLTCQDKEIITVNPDNLEERSLLSDKLSELEKSLLKKEKVRIIKIRISSGKIKIMLYLLDTCRLKILNMLFRL